MKNNEIISLKNIQKKIYNIRGNQVILDTDLANLYQIRPIRLREQVKRNKDRFPNDFMFQLNEDEVNLMVSQNAIPSKKHLGGHLPYVFTEQGVANVSSIIKNDVAIKINIQIIRAFVEMRKFILNNNLILNRLDIIEQKQITTDQKFNTIFNALKNKNSDIKQGIFYKGQIFDSYVFISDIVKKSNKSIILIDNYIDESVLKILTKRKKLVNAVIYTNKISNILKQDLEKHNKQYDKIQIKITKNFHDRFLIIDEKIIFHIGASLKDLGKKLFAFSELQINIRDIINNLK